MNNNTCINVALLFAWIIIYGLFGAGEDAGLLANIAYLFNNTSGLMSLLIYLSPLVAMYLGGKRSSWLYFAPLIWNVTDYAGGAGDNYGKWYFWVSAAISLYASIKLAEEGDTM